MNTGKVRALSLISVSQFVSLNQHEGRGHEEKEVHQNRNRGKKSWSLLWCHAVEAETSSSPVSCVTSPSSVIGDYLFSCFTLRSPLGINASGDSEWHEWIRIRARIRGRSPKNKRGLSSPDFLLQRKEYWCLSRLSCFLSIVCLYIFYSFFTRKASERTSSEREETVLLIPFSSSGRTNTQYVFIKT